MLQGLYQGPGRGVCQVPSRQKARQGQGRRAVYGSPEGVVGQEEGDAKVFGELREAPEIPPEPALRQVGGQVEDTKAERLAEVLPGQPVEVIADR